MNSDLIDLKGITFDADTSWVYYDNAGSNTGGTLTIFETIIGTTTAVDSITFANGDYTTANFKLTSDGSGGTLIKDPRGPDPLGVVEPEATPLTAREQSEARARVLRADDGEVSQAPAFLQARAPEPAAEEPAAEARKPRRRRAPRTVEPGEAAPASETDES